MDLNQTVSRKARRHSGAINRGCGVRRGDVPNAVGGRTVVAIAHAVSAGANQVVAQRRPRTVPAAGSSPDPCSGGNPYSRNARMRIGSDALVGTALDQPQGRSAPPAQNELVNKKGGERDLSARMVPFPWRHRLEREATLTEVPLADHRCRHGQECDCILDCGEHDLSHIQVAVALTRREPLGVTLTGELSEEPVSPNCDEQVANTLIDFDSVNDHLRVVRTGIRIKKIKGSEALIFPAAPISIQVPELELVAQPAIACKLLVGAPLANERETLFQQCL
jgi:hypothetical protein